MARLWETEIKENFKNICQTYSTWKTQERNSTRRYYFRILDRVKAKIYNRENTKKNYYFIKTNQKEIYKQVEEGKKIRGKSRPLVNNDHMTQRKEKRFK